MAEVRETLFLVTHSYESPPSTNGEEEFETINSVLQPAPHSQRPPFFLTPDSPESPHCSAMLWREHPEPGSYQTPRLDQLISGTKGWGREEKLRKESGCRNGVCSAQSHKFRNTRLGCVCYGDLSIARGRIRIQDYFPQRESWQSHLPRVPIKGH